MSDPLELGRLANESPPTLRRDDGVEFHPAWHELLRIGVEHGVHAFPWTDDGPAPHVARAARFMTLAYAEAGVGCPLSMTYAAVPALRHAHPARRARRHRTHAARRVVVPELPGVGGLDRLDHR